MNRVKVIFLDVDGTLTDGKVYLGDKGELMKAFNIKDGFIIHDILPKAGIVPVVITGRSSEILELRCKELGISHLYQGCRDKQTKMLEVADELGLHMSPSNQLGRSLYIGDDLLDIPGMRIAEFVACPADSSKEVVEIADYVSQKKGGEGAVRDIIEYYLRKNGLWDSLVTEIV